MRSPRARALLSTTLTAGGVLLLFFGARDLLESKIGQTEAAEEFEQVVPASIPKRNDVSANARTVEPHTAPATAGSTIAKLEIPRLGSELYVVEGDGARELRRGPGHLTGTALPGQDGNCVIAGHRDTHFRVLKDVRRGDDIVLETAAGKFLYRVRSLSIVSPKNVSSLQPTSDAELNLITCYPFYYVGSAPMRFVVQAKLAGRVTRTGQVRTDMAEAPASAEPGSY